MIFKNCKRTYKNLVYAQISDQNQGITPIRRQKSRWIAKSSGFYDVFTKKIAAFLIAT